MYKHLFFDLDHTLWDFETNSKRALTKIFFEYNLRQFDIKSPDHFIDTYLPINYALWKQFREGKIDAPTIKIKRFQDTFKKFGVIDQELVRDIKSYYLNELPIGGVVMPNVHETLKSLSEQYQLHIITNGFKEVTKRKLEHSQLDSFFDTILSAEEVGVLKPNPLVFNTAFENTKCTAAESLYIGDNLIADVQGARGVGMHQVYFNPSKQAHDENPTYEISDMKELINLLT